MSSQWDAFGRLATLSIQYAHSLSNTATIFANGKNQIEVFISIQINDTNGSTLNISENELKKAVYLCNYRTGKSLPANWLVTFNENKYNRAVSYRSTLIADDTAISAEENRAAAQIVFYISSNALKDDALVAVGIDIPGVGKFDTTAEGTETKNGPNGTSGSKFKSPKYVAINLLQEINYHNVNNLSIEDSGFFTLYSNGWWESRLDVINIYKSHTSATMKRKKIRIKPKTNIDNNYFLEHSIEYDPVVNSDINKGSLSWHGSSHKGFNVIDNLGSGYGLPCAVIGRGYHHDNYQVNFWYSFQNHVKLDGNFYLADNSYVYSCEAKRVDEEYMGQNEHGAATLLLYKVTVPESRCRLYYWYDAIHTATLNVTDIYGNGGSAKLQFDDADFFDTPHIV